MGSGVVRAAGGSGAALPGSPGISSTASRRICVLEIR